MEVFIIAGLIILNGFFSMSELALVSSRKFKLEKAARKGNKNAQRALKLAENPNTFLSTVQIGITLIGILTGIFSGKSMTEGLTVFYESKSFLEPYAGSLAVLSVVLLITYLTIVFGELIPKRLGLNAPEQIASAVAGPMSVLSSISRPLIWILAKTNDFFFKVFGIKERKEGYVTEEEVKALIKQSEKGGDIQEIEQEIVNRVFSLGDRKAGELMRHRNELAWFDVRDSFRDVQKKSAQNPHSIYPVCNGSIEEILGFVRVKELFGRELGEGFEISDFLYKPKFVPENMAAYRVLEQFKANRLHCAIVVDEFGSVQGMVTMDDVMNELVGDTSDTDNNDHQMVQIDESTWWLDGQLAYFELLDQLDLPDDSHAMSFTTVGGLLLSLLNHIPKVGERIKWRDSEFEVAQMEGQRIDKIILRRV